MELGQKIRVLTLESATEADSQVSLKWAEVVKGGKAKQSQETITKIENRFDALREVSLDGGSEGGAGTGCRSSPRHEVANKGLSKTCPVIVVGDSNVRRLEAARVKDSGSRVSFHSFSGAGIERVKV